MIVLGITVKKLPNVYGAVAKWFKAHGFDPCIRKSESYQRCQIKGKQVETPVWPE